MAVNEISLRLLIIYLVCCASLLFCSTHLRNKSVRKGRRAVKRKSTTFDKSKRLAGSNVSTRGRGCGRSEVQQQLGQDPFQVAALDAGMPFRLCYKSCPSNSLCTRRKRKRHLCQLSMPRTSNSQTGWNARISAERYARENLREL